MYSQRVDLADWMDELATRTWCDYEDGYALGLIPGEQSVTDRNLLDIHRHFGDLLSVHRYTSVAEKTIGADWEWWLGSDSEGWVCLRIQAKRIYEKTYRQLGHEGAEEGDFQYDTLIKSCRRRSGYFPFHVFYNGWDTSRFRVGGGGTSEDIAALEHNHWWWVHDEHIGIWGCAALSSFRVADLHRPGARDRAYAPRYLHDAMPWSEIIRSGTRPVAGTTALDRIHDHLLAHTRAHAQDSRTLNDLPRRASREDRVSRLPQYAQAVREGFPGEADGLATATYVTVTQVPSPRRRESRSGLDR